MQATLHTFVGNLGHLLVILSFVTALVATYGYFQATRLRDTPEAPAWRTFSRTSFLLHFAATLGVVACMFYIIYNHYFEYHYAWSHSSRSLPVYYMISCFWEGQEGSFLLWIFWNGLLGTVLMFTNRTWEGPLMSVFALVQAFLVSMILGVVVYKLKIGSSPFILLRDALDDKVFQVTPNFVPTDGRGLNPLLQNYWMVIHPPTLFLGFATTLIPFAYAIAGLWQRQYSAWIRPALPWALFSAAVLGVGILMGAYWAYETLNFGGYWNWDPVENAVYVPWLVLVASVHAMIAHKKNDTALKSAIILTITSFVLILYATFLTRSGVLGNASVHSFTDLGLSGQLLVYLMVFLGLSIALAWVRWKDIPASGQEMTTYSREFWIFVGATILCLSGFQVLVTTSIPVYNKIVEAFGAVSNVALPADQVAHYTRIQLWFAVGIATCSAIGQFFWWKKIDRRSLTDVFTSPLIITLLVTAAVIAFTKPDKLTYIVLLTAAVFSVVANGSILWNVARGNAKLSGGAVAHIGVALMLIGILYSAGYARVVSLNNTGYLISKDEAFTKNNDKENKENLLLYLNQPARMKEYQVTYKGPRFEARGVPGYWRKDLIAATELPYRVVARKPLARDGKTYYAKGDTLTIEAENTYYEVEYRNPAGQVFTLYPRAQVNKQMGLVPSPDIRHGAQSDLYTHVTYVLDPSQPKEWSKTETFTLAPQDTFYVNDYVAILEDVRRVTAVEDVALASSDAAVQATIRVLAKDRAHELKPTFMIKDGAIGMVPEISDELGLRVKFTNVDPQAGKFTFAVNTAQKEFIVLKAKEMPLINVLWLGTLVVTLGFGMAIVRRYREFTLTRDKETKTQAKASANARQPVA